MLLVLGGSTFMGKTLLQELSAMNKYETHYINRGKAYWNNEVKLLPNLHYTYGDRSEKGDFTKLLVYLSKKLDITEESGKKWDCVIDFCAYRRSEVKSVVKALEKLCKCYILISTDSVYDVCDTSVRKFPTILEEYDIRPSNPEIAKKVREDEDYGHDKLRCEEFLYRIQSEGSKFNFINLRLPDVIGPYDDTARFWTMMYWLARSSTYPVEIDDECRNKPLSFVYSGDVIQCILNIIVKATTDDPSLENICKQSYNIGFIESITLVNFLDILADAMGIKYHAQDVRDAKTYYPSVNCGPLNISKALSQLAWQPSKLEDIIRFTCKFFTEAQGKYLKEEQKAIQNLPGMLKQ